MIREMKPGETFAMLDDSLGWAWGYGGEERRVGYVQRSALDQELTDPSQIS